MKNAWTFTGTDEVGKIYRIRDPTYADAIQVVAENAEVSVPEGGTAVARFKLAAQPSAAVAASVRATGGVPAVTALVASVTFTPHDWDQWHEVPLSAADDDIDKVASGHLVCGAGNPAALIATSVKVTPVNNGLHGATTNTLAAYEGPAGLGALQAGSVVRAPDYDGKLDSAAQFSASGWFKAPTQESSWWTVASKKVGITTGPNGENLWYVDKGWYIELPQSKTTLNLIYSTSAQMSVPDVSANWNYFQVVSDGSTLKVYLNGSTSPAKSVNYTVKASGTPYQMCRAGGCNRELRVRNGAASASETALEYATMADESFFAIGEIETVGVFVPAPVFGGEGVPAPAFGVDQSSGNPVFTFSIGNAVKGAKYRIYKTESLSEPFVPFGDVIEAGDSGILDFVVPTADEPSCFFKIVAE